MTNYPNLLPNLLPDIIQMRIHHLINEIMEQKQNVPRKATQEIYKILNNNTALFQKFIEADIFQSLLKRFEDMSNTNDFTSESFKREFEKSFGLLEFYLRKII